MNSEKLTKEPVVIAVPLPIDCDNVQPGGIKILPAVEVTPSIPYRSKRLEKDQYEALEDIGFSKGLAEALSKSVSKFALRIWIVDNSSSMAKNDGHMIVDDGSRIGGMQSIPCSR